MTETPPYRPRKYLSVSTLLSYVRCPRRYFYSKCGLEPPEESVAPVYGTAHHKAVPVALTTFDLDLTMAAFDSVWDTQAEIMAERGDYDPKRNRKRAEQMLKHYIHTHEKGRSLFNLIPPPSGTIEVDERTSDYEVPWMIDIGLPVPLGGRFDSLCAHRDTKETWIWEFKTTSRLTAKFFEAHEMSVQNLTYALAAKILMGEPVMGVMVEGMLSDKSKVDNMVQTIPVHEHHLDDILRWLQVNGARLLDAEARYLEALESGENPERFFEKNFGACSPYAMFYMPGFFCEYGDLCRVPDYRMALPFYRVAPEHNMLEITVNDDAKKTSTPS